MASHPRPETELKGNSKVGFTVLGKKRKQPLFVLQAAIKAETRLRKDIGAHGDVIFDFLLVEETADRLCDGGNSSPILLLADNQQVVFADSPCAARPSQLPMNLPLFVYPSTY